MNTHRKTNMALIVSALAASAAISSAGLIVHYTFDNDDAANDGTGAAGTVSGGSTFADTTRAGDTGRVWVGNRTGANDAHIKTSLSGDDVGLGLNGSYTLAAWVLWDGASGENDQIVFGQDDGVNGGAPQLHHGIRSNADDATLNLHFGGWGGNEDIGDAGAIAAGDWTHVAWQFEDLDPGDALDAGVARVFVNGVQSATANIDGAANPGLDVIIGGVSRYGSTPTIQSFNGSLDDVRIYDEVLTPSAIAALAVPEPSSLGLLLLSGMALLRRRR